MSRIQSHRATVIGPLVKLCYPQKRHKRASHDLVLCGDETCLYLSTKHSLASFLISDPLCSGSHCRTLEIYLHN